MNGVLTSIPTAWSTVPFTTRHVVRGDLVGVHCTNPQCVTSIEHSIEQTFYRTQQGIYRCEYCDKEATR